MMTCLLEYLILRTGRLILFPETWSILILVFSRIEIPFIVIVTYRGSGWIPDLRVVDTYDYEQWTFTIICFHYTCYIYCMSLYSLSHF